MGCLKEKVCSRRAHHLQQPRQNDVMFRKFLTKAVLLVAFLGLSIATQAGSINTTASGGQQYGSNTGWRIGGYGIYGNGLPWPGYVTVSKWVNGAWVYQRYVDFCGACWGTMDAAGGTETGQGVWQFDVFDNGGNFVASLHLDSTTWWGGVGSGAFY